MRLDRFISDNTHFSRKEASRLINQGRVLVNRQVTRQGNLKVTLQDCVEMDGQVIEVAGEAYFMLNKPAGYECTTVGSDAPTVLDLLDSNDCRTRNLQIAGRLDKDTTGLVLLTSDGGWNHRITAPGKQFGKEYWVEVAESITDEAVTRIEQGLLLKGENKPTLPAQIERLSPTTALLTLHEGSTIK